MDSSAISRYNTPYETSFRTIVRIVIRSSPFSLRLQSFSLSLSTQRSITQRRSAFEAHCDLIERISEYSGGIGIHFLHCCRPFIHLLYALSTSFSHLSLSVPANLLRTHLDTYLETAKPQPRNSQNSKQTRQGPNSIVLNSKQHANVIIRLF
jgi:hypothetical protein